MYEAYFGLKKKPFTLISDAEFLYMGNTHSAAFAMLEYGVLNQAGFTVITGEVGSGKTTLIQHLLKQLPGKITVGLITNTRKNMGELLPWVLHSFKLDYREQHPVALYENFSKFLQKQFELKKRTVLIIDEAQNLGEDVLEELRMLSNINATNDQFLQVILVGQPELRELLSKPQLMQFSQRVTVDYHIAPLTPLETASYIKWRLVQAGAERDLFTKAAYQLIYAASRGVPRLINVLCDTALSFAFGDRIKVIDEEYLMGVLKERAEGGLLALGQNPMRQLGDKAFQAQDFEQLFNNVVTSIKSRRG
ncbi:ExeA family protein [Ketobacter sp.]|uniref:ExeA family protein n=1 Tax=Ketobacter sp. TaxID=2083498 RepID=UPI000F2CC653|nr:AAA family ATPase [Ketobacter sp.]RLT93658.1 MAG: DUF2075 domain-containing protein [Ketobacter sp.]